MIMNKINNFNNLNVAIATIKLSSRAFQAEEKKNRIKRIRTVMQNNKIKLLTKQLDELAKITRETSRNLSSAWNSFVSMKKLITG